MLWLSSVTLYTEIHKILCTYELYYMASNSFFTVEILGYRVVQLHEYWHQKNANDFYYTTKVGDGAAPAGFVYRRVVCNVLDYEG